MNVYEHHSVICSRFFRSQLSVYHTYPSARLSRGPWGSQRTTWSLKQKDKKPCFIFLFSKHHTKRREAVDHLAEYQNKLTQCFPMCHIKQVFRSSWIYLILLFRNSFFKQTLAGLHLIPEDLILQTLPSVLAHQGDPERMKKQSIWYTLS